MNDKDIYARLSFESELREIGIDGIRAHVAAETWKVGSPLKHGQAIEVVRRFDASQAAASEAKRDAATIAIAREANDIARSASFAATAAASAASEANAIARSALRTSKKNMTVAVIAAIAAIVAAYAAIKGIR